MTKQILRTAIFVTGVSAFSQTPADKPEDLTSYSTNIANALKQITATGYTPGVGCDDLAERIVSIECQNQLGFLTYLAASPRFRYHSFLQTAEKAFSGIQPGSPSGSAGSTTLVSKAAVPEVIGLAVDAGALTQSTSGTTTTFTGNARGLYRFLTGKEVFPYCPGKRTCGNGAARRLSGSISMDTPSSGTGTAPTSGTTSAPSASTPSTSFSGSNWRMSSWGVHFQVPLGKFDPNGNGVIFQKAWDKQMDSLAKSTPTAPIVAAAKTLNASFADTLDKIETSDDYKKWKAAAKADIATLLSTKPAPDQKALEERLRLRLDDLLEKVANAQYISTAQIQAALTASNGFFAAREDIISAVEGKLPGLSLSYTNAHPLNQANVSNFKLVFQMQPKPGVISLTANVAADIYDALPAGSTVGRWRDLQISGQTDFTLPSQYDHAVLSLAGYYQYMATRAVLQIPVGNTAPGTDINLPGSAATLLAPPGNLWIAQALVTFPLKNSTTKIPFGVSYANRSELLTGHVFRAHIGLNFNFDSLFMK